MASMKSKSAHPTVCTVNCLMRHHWMLQTGLTWSPYTRVFRAGRNLPAGRPAWVNYPTPPAVISRRWNSCAAPRCTSFQPARNAAKTSSANTLLIYNPDIAPVSRLWLVHARLDLSFLQPIAQAMDFSPARRPAAPVRRQHPRDWCNIRVSAISIIILLILIKLDWS